MGVAALVLMTSQSAQAQEPAAELDSTELAASAPKQDSPQETTSPASYAVPLVGIVGFDFLLNRAGERFIDHETYHVTGSSVRRNLKGPWVVDNDPFSVNQFLHPYQGAMYHGFARSAGLNYWQSLGYTFTGSALWEIAGEAIADPVIEEATAALKAGGGDASSSDPAAIFAANKELLTLHELIAHRLVQVLLGAHRGRTFH